MLRQSCVIGTLLLGMASVAQAQDPFVTTDPNQTGGQIVVEEETRSEGRGIQYGAHIGAGLFLGSDLDINPGLAVQIRGGYELTSWLSLELAGGIDYHGVGIVGGGDGTLFGWWVGAGARFLLLNPTAIVPIFGAMIQYHAWDLDNDAGITVGDDSSVGLVGIVGVAYEVTSSVAVEVLVQPTYNITLDSVGAFGGSNEFDLQILAGITLYLHQNM